MRGQKWFLVVGLIALLAAAGSGLYAYCFYDSLITTATVVTVSETVPPYALLTTEMLEEKPVPRGILDEPIYRSANELVGSITTATLIPGQLIYRHQAVPVVNFRYTDDPSLEVVSFPVDPAKAVGGQVRIGQQINIYRVLKVDSNALELSEKDGILSLPKEAEAETLAENVPVVDVRASRGEPAGQQVATSRAENVRSEMQHPTQIITVAVPPGIAKSLVELAVEDQGDYEIWVSLAPLTVENAEAKP